MSSDNSDHNPSSAGADAQSPGVDGNMNVESGIPNDDGRPLHVYSTGLMGRIVESASLSSSASASPSSHATPSADEDDGACHDDGERAMIVELDNQETLPPMRSAEPSSLSSLSTTTPTTSQRTGSLSDVTNIEGDLGKRRRSSLLILILANRGGVRCIEEDEEEDDAIMSSSKSSSTQRRHTVTLPLVHRLRGHDSRDDDDDNDRDAEGEGGGGAVTRPARRSSETTGSETDRSDDRGILGVVAAESEQSGRGGDHGDEGHVLRGDNAFSSPSTSNDYGQDEVQRSAGTPPFDPTDVGEGEEPALDPEASPAGVDDGFLVTCTTSQTESDSDGRQGSFGVVHRGGGGLFGGRGGGGRGGRGGRTSWSPLRRGGGRGPLAAANTLAKRSTQTLSSWREHEGSRRSIDTSFGSDRQGTTSRGGSGSADEEQAKRQLDEVDGHQGGRGGCHCDPRREGVTGLLRRTCLNPRYSLRMQLFLSFGTVSAGAILILMVAAIVTMASAGRDVETKARRSLETGARTNVLRSTRFVAETLGKKIENLERMASFLAEATRDRYVGYPDDPGYGDDLHVPFRDITTGRNAYPLDTTSRYPLPLEWQVEPHVTEENHDEHVQDRFGWYGGGGGGGGGSGSTTLSTATAMYMMQGQCDPNASGGDWTYHPNCTDANNDVETGGTVRPTSTNYHLYTKAADLAIFMKPLYEYYRDVMRLGVFFANSGAGSLVSFPSTVTDGTSAYTSVGCDWMNATNPVNPAKGLIATPEEMERCHPAGVRVGGREYNPLERSWCRDQALDPTRSHGAGPYLDAWSSEPLWLMTFGRAVYDRLTDEFIACILIDVTTDRFTDIVNSAVGGVDEDTASSTADVALVRFDDRGTVVASSGWDSAKAGEMATVSGLGPTMGVTLEMYHHIKSRVNFSSTWDPDDVRDAYEGTTYKGDDGRLVSASVIPIPPSTYDESYVPEFMVIMSVKEDEVYSDAFGRMDDEIYGSVMSSCRFTLILGVIGIAAMLLFIFAVSCYLTRPLNWLERTGKVILDNFGYGLKHIDLDLGASGALGRCSPQTEISALVKEFRKMVREFSGKGTAAIVKKEVHETKNPFTLFAEFQDLYYSRQNEGFRYRYQDESPSIGQQQCSKQSLSCPRSLPRRRNYGPNISRIRAASKSPRRKSSFTSKLPPSSPLFWWIVGIIVTPLMISMILIFAFVVIHVLRETPMWLVDVKYATSVQERRSLEVATALRALYASEVMKQPVGDLHVYSRVAAWLLFDAVQRSDSFTEVLTGVERCKTYSKGQCPWIKDAPCDCDWNDISGVECRDYGADNDTRYLQRSWYVGPSENSTSNGDRNSTSYPLVSYSAATTEWWDDVNNMPGSHKGSNASGYETTYDRVRVISALSPVEIALYNSAANGNRGQKNIGTHIGFEADGMIIGYSGCGAQGGDNSKFRSTVGNGAEKLAPHLCPLDKYGYDSRCRGWYAHARDNGLDAQRLPDRDGPLLHVTPPYVFPGTYDMTGQSCSFPFVDPRTEFAEVVGVSLVDFLPEPIVKALQVDNTPTGPGHGGFPILITALADSSGSDTVVGPGFAMGDEAVPISDVVLPFDSCGDDSGSDSEGCRNRRRFEEVVKDMRAGAKGTANFARKQSDGSSEELYITYAPVSVMSAHPYNHADFTRGVHTHDDSLIFSLALAVPESDLLISFTQIEDDLNGVLILSVALFITLLVLTVAVVVFISSRVAVSVTRPINRLLDIVQKINRHDIQDDIPVHQGGSSEVVRVYRTFEKLYKVVRVANSAFFGGDLSKSYEVLTDALVTFMQLDDEKAVGIANNNLGNTMLSMYEKLESTGRHHICSMSREEIIEKGIVYFDHAIRSGERALDSTNDECGWSNMYVVFMQQLSNRYFNRAMFLLTVCRDHPRPDEAEEQGKRDLMVAKDMDTEVIDYRVQEGLPCDKEAHFDLMLGRVNGLIRLAQQSYSIDWDVQELVDDAIAQLSSSFKDRSHSPFQHIGPVGRMQQLEAALVEFVECNNDDIEEAARIGIRMLVEDEYVQPEAALICIDAIIAFLGDRRGRGNTISTETQRQVKEYRRTLQRQVKAEVSRRSKLRYSQYSSCRTDSSKSMCMEAY